MGLLDLLSDTPAPVMKKRRGYDPANYSAVKDSGLYAALNSANQAQNQATSQSGARLAGQYGAVPQDAGAMREMAMRAQLGALQPMDEAQKMKQFQNENQDAREQDARARQLYDFQRQSQAKDADFYGGIIGAGLGAGGAYLGNRASQQRLGKARAKGQRSSLAYGPINNPYSQGW